MSEKEKKELIREFENADQRDRAKDRDTSPFLEDKFEEKIRELMNPTVSYWFIPYNQMWKEFDAIHDALGDPYITSWNAMRIRYFIRRYLLDHPELGWMDRNAKHHRHMRGILPDGNLTGELSGWGKIEIKCRPPMPITPESSYPRGYLLEKRPPNWPPRR